MTCKRHHMLMYVNGSTLPRAVVKDITCFALRCPIYCQRKNWHAAPSIVRVKTGTRDDSLKTGDARSMVVLGCRLRPVPLVVVQLVVGVYFNLVHILAFSLLSFTVDYNI
jgi:hypothetical protein